MGKKWSIPVCVGVTVAVGILLWWLYARFPNPVTAILAPITGSPWETGKLIFWPYIAGALLEWKISGGTGSRSGHCMILVLMPLLLTALCWLGPAFPVAVVWLTVLSVGAALYAFVLRRRLWGGELLWYTLAILLGIAYLLFTVLPPMGGPFTDSADVSAMGTIPY
ncbi:MAG: hypothetical protein KBS74_06975 [Clostridiales bacterium]|nr:hypothetical protein [Candidatus Cacconaster stercorequi]